jgi:hypothetical protein
VTPVRPLRLATAAVVAAAMAAGISGCSSIGLGISIPIGIGSIGVSVGSDGRVSGGVQIGQGGVSVGVGGTADLPRPTPKPTEVAASAPKT